MLPPPSYISDSGISNTLQNSSYGVVGILSANKETNRKYRDELRATWVKDSQKHNVQVYFLLDVPTNELERERRKFGDLLYLNSNYSGRGVGFGEKLALWLKIAMKRHPDAAFVGKIDDDNVVCAERAWPFVWNTLSSTLYLGYFWFGRDNMIPSRPDKFKRMDEMFVILGSDLVAHLSGRRICYADDECNLTSDLHDTNFGGTSLGVWLSRYDNLDIVPINDLQPSVGRIETADQIVLGCNCLNNFLYIHPIKNPSLISHAYNTSLFDYSPSSSIHSCARDEMREMMQPQVELMKKQKPRTLGLYILDDRAPLINCSQVGAKLELIEKMKQLRCNNGKFLWNWKYLLLHLDHVLQRNFDAIIVVTYSLEVASYMRNSLGVSVFVLNEERLQTKREGKIFGNSTLEMERILLEIAILSQTDYFIGSFQSLASRLVLKMRQEITGLELYSAYEKMWKK